MNKQELGARRNITEAMRSLDPAARERVLNRVIDGVPELLRKHGPPLKTIPVDERAWAAIDAWIAGPFVLGKNDCSRVHKVIEAMKARAILSNVGEHLYEHEEQFISLLTHSHTFVVQHDYARAFAGAEVTGDGEPGAGFDFRLPYPECIFEFQVSGRVVVFLLGQFEDDQAGLFFVQGSAARGEWWATAGTKPIRDFLHSHVRAISIALDAEVATHEIIRGPAKLNESRAKKNLPPLRDYHVIQLHGRITQRAPYMGGEHKTPRLHFRRGHWRHYSTHTTWIRWTLVGNPDLGFIDKGYRL